MMVIKRKQIVVLALVIMIVIAGYLQYSYRKGDITASKDDDKGKLGEAVYVDNNGSQDEDGHDLLLSEEDSFGASIEANEFFAQAKLDREITRSMDSDALREIIDNPNAAEDVKVEAFNTMMALIETNDLEMRIENLIKERGFGDAIALFGNDGSIDIIVKSASLTDAKVAQITDIVTRHANVEVSQVHIKNKY
jgi:stage III sporulation protein AH